MLAKVKFKDIRFKAELYSNNRFLKKGETFRKQHETDFINGYKQALIDINKTQIIHERFNR